jgi:hypothetical protein
MDFPKCKGCEKKFDLKKYQPLILPKCGHTYCSVCISNQINKNGFMICPMDKQSYRDMKLDSFPLNKEMTGFFSTQQKKICKTHDKVLDYFCLTDKLEICALCGLFGEHKDHKITTTVELNDIIKKKINKIDNEIKNFKYLQDIKNAETINDLIMNKITEVLKENKNNLLKQYNVS